MAEETRQTKLQQWPYPEAGLNTEYSPSHAPISSLIKAENIYYKHRNMLKSRAGFEELYSVSVTGGIQHIYAVPSRDELYWSDGDGNLWRDGTPISGVTNKVTDMVSYSITDESIKIYVAEEKGSQGHTLHVYDPSTDNYSQLTGDDVPDATKLMVRFSQLWATGEEANPSRIYWSSYGDPSVWVETYSGGGHATIAPGYYGDIIDWIEWDGTLYVAKEQGWYALSGNNPRNFRTGALGKHPDIIPNTTSDVVKGVMFCTGSGVYPLGRQSVSGAQNLTSFVESDIQDALGNNTQGEFAHQIGCYVVSNGTDSLWVSSVFASPDIWTRFTLPYNITSLHDGTKLYLGTDDGRILAYDPDRWTDPDGKYDVEIQSGFWNLGTSVLKSRVEYIEGPMSATDNCDLNIGIYKDGHAERPIMGGGWHISSGELQAKKLNFEARSVSIKLSYEDLSGPAYFRGVALHASSVRRELS